MQKLVRDEFSHVSMIQGHLNSLRNGDALLIKGIPSSDAIDFLETAICDIGYPGESVSKTNNASLSNVYEVTARDTPLKTIDGYNILSSTNLGFPAHADCFFDEKPCDVVFLYCAEEASSGGETQLWFLDQILKELPIEDAVLLRKMNILTSFGIRYNRYELNNSKKTTLEENSMLDRFDSLLATPHAQFKLREEECIVINNHKTLHGRGTFSDNNGKRRLLRSRAFFK